MYPRTDDASLQEHVWRLTDCGLGFRVWDMGFVVEGLGFRDRVWGLGVGVQGSGSRIQVKGLGFRV